MDLKMKKFITLKSIIVLYIVPYIVIFIALYFIGLIDKESKITFTSFGSGLGGLIVIIGLYFFYQRLEKQQKQIDIQINQRVDDRFNSAINLLGSSETSARTGAIYALYELAIEEEKYRSQITQILCSHIRSKTNEAEYKKTHSKRPSNEIQTTIDLLFKEEGLYAQGFKGVAKPSKANLSHAYLMGVNFTGAQCQGVDFSNAQCQGTFFLVYSVKGRILRVHSVRGRFLCLHSVRRRILGMHSVRGCILWMHSVRGRILRMHSVRGCILRMHSVRGRIFRMRNLADHSTFK
ncbi:hypothetical protein [uncultured Gammaproteobacteria bacterium]|nr:hypothetical protein [uncultured Gammaproteobacteria bacterium]